MNLLDMELASIHTKIFEVRGIRVMFDYDLADLYEVETRALKQAVKRNMERFPEDFMIQLTNEEVEFMVSQFVIPSKQHLGGALPFAFTEQGVAMLSSVLKSKRALQVNIAIMRAFVTLRKYALNYSEIASKLCELEQQFNRQFADVYDALNYLMSDKQEREAFEERKRIGFKSIE
jgi:hypothetical protein